jgi:hypothetical protein
MRILWRYNRRGVLISVGLLVTVLVLLGGSALAVRLFDSGHRQVAQVHPSGDSSVPTAQPSGQSPATGSPAAIPTDVASWEAILPVSPAISSAYPAITGDAMSDPSTYAQAFATELFTRDYRHCTRDDLIRWAQWEDSPLRASNYPRSVWSKVLVNSLTDLTWDNALDTPVPAVGEWLALRSQQGRQTVSELKVSLNPVWEKYIADGNQPPDRLATVRDVSLTVTVHTVVSGKAVVSKYSVYLAFQLGSSTRHAGYAMAVSNNYAVRKVS